MPLGLFGSSSAGVKPQQLDNRLAAGSAASAEAKDSKGTIVKFTKHTVVIDKKLAEGGFAVVFLASDKHNRRYALKRQFISGDTCALEACKREYRIVSSLIDHKNIVKYIDHLLVKNSSGIYEYSLLTAYYKRSVLQLMNERLTIGRHLSAKEILSIFCDVCEAVARLHHSQTPVIHRDLKVENVLIDDRQRGRPPIYILCDFGSATTKVMSAETHTLQYIEEDINRYTTLSYRAPEMVDLCFSNPIGTKSDIWAMGVMLFKLCYFTLPFADNALAIQNCSYAFPAEPKYPEELRAIISTLIEVDISRRPDIYQTSCLAFEVAGLSSPVPNPNKVVALRISDALRILKENRDRLSKAREVTDGDIRHSSQAPGVGSFKIADSNLKQVKLDSDRSVATSVNPRLRPKPLCALNTLDLSKSVGSPLVAKEIISPIDCLSDPSIGLHQNSLSNPDIGPLFCSDDVSKYGSDDTRNRDVEHKMSHSPSSNNRHTSAPQLFENKSEVKKFEKNGLEKWNLLLEKPKSSAFKPYSADKDDCHSWKQSALKISNHKEFCTDTFDDLTWNPFLDAPFDMPSLSASKVKTPDTAPNISMDDGSFGKCFDRLPRVGQARTPRTLGSPEIDESDPFGAAPFDPKILNLIKDEKLVAIDSRYLDAGFDTNTSESASEKEIPYEIKSGRRHADFDYEHLGERVYDHSTGSQDMLESSMSEDDELMDRSRSADWSSGQGIFSMLSEGNTKQPLLDDDELENENHTVEDDVFRVSNIQPSTPLAPPPTLSDQDVKNWFLEGAGSFENLRSPEGSASIEFDNSFSTNPFSQFHHGPSISVNDSHRSGFPTSVFSTDTVHLVNPASSTGSTIKSPQSAPPIMNVRNSLQDANVFQSNFLSEEFVSTSEEKSGNINRKTRNVSTSSDEYPQTDDSAAEMFSGNESFSRGKSTFSPRSCRRRKMESAASSVHRENIAKITDQGVNLTSKASPIFKKSVKHFGHNRRTNPNALDGASFVNNSYLAEDWEGISRSPVKM